MICGCIIDGSSLQRLPLDVAYSDCASSSTASVWFSWVHEGRTGDPIVAVVVVERPALFPHIPGEHLKAGKGHKPGEPVPAHTGRAFLFDFRLTQTHRHAHRPGSVWRRFQHCIVPAFSSLTSRNAVRITIRNPDCIIPLRRC